MDEEIAPIHFDGSTRDIERLAQAMIRNARWESPCAGERQVHWDDGLHSGWAGSLELRSGLIMTSTVARTTEPFAMNIDHAPSDLEFCITRGTGGMRAHASDGTPASLFVPGQLQVAQIKRRSRFLCEAPGGSDDGSVHVTLPVQRLCELVGTTVLPKDITAVLEDTGPFCSRATAMNSRMYTLIDDILECTAKGPTRQLYLEAKGLELVALAVDRFTEAQSRDHSPLSEHDIDRLHRARALLLSGLDSPPPLSDLARHAGMNERKLKMGFKALFGTPVYTYLRAQRMERARALLGEGRYSVAQVAQMVGYANPSKFSSAFRRQFGQTPRNFH